MVHRMTPRQRFLAALRGEAVDRPPAASIVSVANFELLQQVGPELDVVQDDLGGRQCEVVEE